MAQPEDPTPTARGVDSLSRSGDPMTQPIERKLAAILSADVVGYSRLMAEE